MKYQIDKFPSTDNSGDLLSVIDQDLLPLMPDFLDRREKDVIELRHLIDNNDYSSIQFIGHKLKGTGGGYGLQIITTIGRAIEVAASLQDAEIIRTQVQELANVTQCLRGLLKLSGISGRNTLNSHRGQS
jgi:HPt (histidine-containing phosphotransfer) domain-containing protein